MQQLNVSLSINERNKYTNKTSPWSLLQRWLRLSIFLQNNNKFIVHTHLTQLWYIYYIHVFTDLNNFIWCNMKESIAWIWKKKIQRGKIEEFQRNLNNDNNIYILNDVNNSLRTNSNFDNDPIGLLCRPTFGSSRNLSSPKRLRRRLVL